MSRRFNPITPAELHEFRTIFGGGAQPPRQIGVAASEFVSWAAALGCLDNLNSNLHGVLRTLDTLLRLAPGSQDYWRFEGVRLRLGQFPKGTERSGPEADSTSLDRDDLLLRLSGTWASHAYGEAGPRIKFGFNMDDKSSSGVSRHYLLAQFRPGSAGSGRPRGTFGMFGAPVPLLTSPGDFLFGAICAISDCFSTQNFLRIAEHQWPSESLRVYEIYREHFGALFWGAAGHWDELCSQHGMPDEINQ